MVLDQVTTVSAPNVSITSLKGKTDPGSALTLHYASGRPEIGTWSWVYRGDLRRLWPGVGEV